MSSSDNVISLAPLQGATEIAEIRNLTLQVPVQVSIEQDRLVARVAPDDPDLERLLACARECVERGVLSPREVVENSFLLREADL